MRPGQLRREIPWVDVRGCLAAIPMCLTALIISRLYPVSIPSFVLAILLTDLLKSKLAPYFATLVSALLYYLFVVRVASPTQFHSNNAQLISLIVVGCTSAVVNQRGRNRAERLIDGRSGSETISSDKDDPQISEESLSKQVELIPGLIYIRRPDGTLEQINHRVIEFSNIPLNVMLEDDGITAIHPDDRVRVSELWRLNFSGTSPFCCEFRHVSAEGGYRWVLASAEPQRNGRGEVVRWYILLTDIEDRKAMESSLRLVQAKLGEASRISTVAELTASVAHEISQPLSG